MDSDIDKFDVAAAAGGRVARAQTLTELGRSMASWPVDAERAVHTARAFNANVISGALQPSRSRFRQALEASPFIALEVQPAITFTYGGIRTDAHGRVLDAGGRPLRGLLAAGVDAGGLNRSGYSGGLSRGLVFGLRAAQVVNN
jgi:predicted oxidoreductase